MANQPNDEMEILEGDVRVAGDKVGYMELSGAVKDGDCHKVAVEGGVSSQLGCCNIFDPLKRANQFRCGTCEYFKKEKVSGKSE